jgi:hypothetical protein
MNPGRTHVDSAANFRDARGDQRLHSCCHVALARRAAGGEDSLSAVDRASL